LAEATAVNTRKVGIFIGLAFLLNWLMIAVFYLVDHLLSVAPSSESLPEGETLFPAISWIVLGVYMFVPALAALLVQRRIYKEPVIEPLGISFKVNRWWVLGWLVPFFGALAVFGVSLLLPGVEFTSDLGRSLARYSAGPPQGGAPEPIAPAAAIIVTSLQALLMGASFFAGAALGEELGWRGLLQRELAPLGFWRSAAFIGFTWGVWHAPLVAQRNWDHPWGPMLVKMAFCLLLAPLLGYVRLRAKSVIASAIAYGTMNTSMALAVLFVARGSDPFHAGFTGLAGLIVLALFNVGILIYDRYLDPTPALSR
jgi:uncharacterized protein